MYITNRVVSISFLLAGLLPLATFAFVLNTDERIAAEQAYQGAIANAANDYRATRGLPALERQYQQEVNKALVALQPIEKKRRALRAQIVAKQKAEAKLRQRFALNVDGEKATAEEKSAAFGTLARDVWEGTQGQELNALQDIVLRTPAEKAGDVTGHAVARAVLFQIAGATDRSNELETLVLSYDQLLTDSQGALTEYRDASQNLKKTQDRIAEIQRIVEEVHQQVIRLQGSLARIDAKIRAKVERDLIAKGLLDPGTIDHSLGAETPTFIWPVYGPLSAVFNDAKYRDYFGVPHRAIDIAVGQGSPVAAAADGVVFLARDGGATGFSYILIGHRGGYATLYGHLSRFNVSAGEDVTQGQIIGLSGGQPGTHGAGPMTTGPHVHLEVIENGVNINPKGVLP
ncbi:MAG: M23 family metallopeptidase [Candidatus Peregrinibacteria bacterium]